MGVLSTTLMVATLASVSAGPDSLAPPATAAVRAFAGAMAVAKTVADRCTGITVDEGLIEGLHERLHIGESDGPAIAVESRYVANLLSRTIGEARDVKSWCDATFDQYGPAGTTLPGLLSR